MYQALGWVLFAAHVPSRSRLTNMAKCNAKVEKHLTQLSGPRTALLLKEKITWMLEIQKAQITVYRLGNIKIFFKLFFKPSNPR